MSMHLVHPGLTTLNGKNKKKPSAKQLKAKADHDAWLRKQGLHPDQLSARIAKKPNKLNLELVKDKSGQECSNGFAPGGFKKSVFDSRWQKTYDDPYMAEREEAALKKAEAKKTNIMQTYNKGPVMYASNLKMTELGRRR